MASLMSFQLHHPGDVTRDGYVGGTDLATIISHWGQSPATYDDGDLSGDGIVDGLDYAEVVSFWGTGVFPTEPPAVIPEPATLGLLLIGGGILLRRGVSI